MDSAARVRRILVDRVGIEVDQRMHADRQLPLADRLGHGWRPAGRIGLGLGR
jgi:hypothetical protein